MFALDEYRLRRWVNRNLIAMYRFLFRRRGAIIEYPRLRKAKYHMIFAIHESSFQRLGRP